MPRFIPRLFLYGGATGIRTPDLLRAKQPLSHLSYRPETKRELSISQFSTFLVGVGGLEPPTSILSGSRSNLLSYTPLAVLYHTRAKHATLRSRDDKIPRCCVAVKQKNGALRASCCILRFRFNRNVAPLQHHRRGAGNEKASGFREHAS
jgi:hypothetical protein